MSENNENNKRRKWELISDTFSNDLFEEGLEEHMQGLIKYVEGKMEAVGEFSAQKALGNKRDQYNESDIEYYGKSFIRVASSPLDTKRVDFKDLDVDTLLDIANIAINYFDQLATSK